MDTHTDPQMDRQTETYTVTYANDHLTHVSVSATAAMGNYAHLRSANLPHKITHLPFILERYDHYNLSLLAEEQFI